MKTKRLLDSFALLAYLNSEPGSEIVQTALKEAQETDTPVLMNEINIGETFYIIYRRRGPREANYLIETILAGLPILRVPNPFELVLEAAGIKAEYPIAFSDCFAVATARRESAIIITGDAEFKKVEHFVDIEWIR